jgi:hypothetical protein
MHANILVGVLTAAAAAWIVWAEMNSRRNTARQKADVRVEATETDPPQSSRKKP